MFFTGELPVVEERRFTGRKHKFEVRTKIKVSQEDTLPDWILVDCLFDRRKNWRHICDVSRYRQTTKKRREQRGKSERDHIYCAYMVKRDRFACMNFERMYLTAFAISEPS